MIVTKEIADRYILKRGCYLIREQPDGDHTISYESLNWKEGMEVFETLEECQAEITRRLEARKKPGDCPRCYNTRIVEAKVEIGLLEVLPGKTDPFYRCTRCHTVWYKAKSNNQFTAYDKSVADYVLDWSSRDLKPSRSFRKILNENISSDRKKEEVYLQSVTLKNGEEHPCAIIRLTNFPPERHWFERKDLFFFDQVNDIKPSPYAYPFSISKKAWKERDFIYIKDVRTKEVFRFDALVTMFTTADLAGREFVLDEERPGTKCITIAERDERGPTHWYFNPPPDPIYIWADRG